MTVVYAGGGAMHKRLLEFIARSPQRVEHGGWTYIIHHSQFASYDLRDAFTTVVEGTETDPRFDESFKADAEDAVKDATATIEDYGLRNNYTKREYIKPDDLNRAASDYRMCYNQLSQGERPFDATIPKAQTREDAIAEVFTLMLAQNAAFQASHPFPSTGLRKCDDDDDEKPDEGTDCNLAQYAIRDSAYELHGASSLRQPDPSLHTSRVIYRLYDEIGMNPDIRHVYGFLVDPALPSHYEPNDMFDRKMLASAGNLMLDAMTGRGNANRDEKWTSENEPPLESLDSYDNGDE